MRTQRECVDERKRCAVAHSSCSLNHVRRWRPFFYFFFFALVRQHLRHWVEWMLSSHPEHNGFISFVRDYKKSYSIERGTETIVAYALNAARQKGIRRLSIRMNRTLQAGCYYKNLYENRKQRFDSVAKSCDTKHVIVCLRLINECRNANVECLLLYWPFGKGELFVAMNWLGSRSLTENEYK